MKEIYRIDEMHAQDKTTVKTSSQEYSLIVAEDIGHIHRKKEKFLKKEPKMKNCKKVNEESKENIYFNKNRNKQCLSTYDKKNSKIENLIFPGNKDIKNNKMNKNKSTSKIAFVQYKKKKTSLYHSFRPYPKHRIF